MSSGEPGRGVPELWQAQDAGDFYHIKLWPGGSNTAAVKALWNREVRSLSRLQGYPGATELFVRLFDLRSDAAGFYAVLDAGNLTPLSGALERRSSVAWLKNLGEFGRRKPLWEGLLRIAEALTILHGEGTLHRALSSSAVFVDMGGLGQFRLSGFEWSLRVAAPKGEAVRVGKKKRLQAPELDKVRDDYSVNTDWYDFGLVAAELFGLPGGDRVTREGIRHAITTTTMLRTSERVLLLQLLEPDPDLRMTSGEAVTQAIRDVVRELGSAASAPGRPFLLAVRLGANQEFTAAVERASEGTAKASDPVRQLHWIQQDLSGDVRVTARARPHQMYILRGKKLEYRVRAWTQAGSETWAVAFCEKAESSPRSEPADSYYSIGERTLEIQLFPQVKASFSSYRDRSSPWDKAFPFSGGRRELEPHLKDIHDFFRISQQIDTLLIAAQICPIEIVASDRSASETEVVLTPREEVGRNDLAQHLYLARPSEQMRDWFNVGADPVASEDDEDPDHDKYRLLDRRTIESDGSKVVWRFRGATPHPKGTRYTFTADTSVVVHEGPNYLARNHNGVLSQIRRRHRAIEAMRSYEGLLRLFSDPLGVARDTQESLPLEGRDIKLDKSKRDALEHLWSRHPAFSIQGPPGTGKTTLIKGFTSKLFGSDPSAQILISAHSHHTVDDVRRKIASMFVDLNERDRPIIVRLGAKNPTEHDPQIVTEAMIERLANSDLASNAPSGLKKKVTGMLAGTAASDEFRSMQSLVQEAANVTLTTSNSGDLAELTTRGRRFDWSLVEEAGKAHGFDMAAAMQASHRLILIGDHYQLDPFNAKLFKDLFADPVRLRAAIEAGVAFAPSLIDTSVIDDNGDIQAFANRCETWRGMVTFFGDFFTRSLGDGVGTPLAATLTQQHRMHPSIAKVVGQAFYPNDGPTGTLLESPPETHAEFEKEAPFSLKAGSWLPDERVVWCDVPWIQKKEFSQGESEGVFASEVEASRVVDILNQFEPRGTALCELQILSPYNDQLDCIRGHLEAPGRRAGSVRCSPRLLTWALGSGWARLSTNFREVRRTSSL